MITYDEPTVAMWVFLAFVVERLVEAIVKMVPAIHKKVVLGIEVPVIVAFVLSLAVAIATDLCFFAVFHIPCKVPFLGYVFSALVMTGGSSLIHDITGWVRARKEMDESHAARLKSKV